MGFMKKFKRNTKGKDYVVGDLHGCYDMLMDQLDDLCFNFESDRLFCCGDLIDRGDKSLECLMLMYEPWFFSVRGNHEQMMIDYYVHQQPDGGCWHYNGGVWELDENPIDMKMWASEADYLLPYQIEIDESIGIIHADIGSSWKEVSESNGSTHNCLWDRSRIKNPSIYGDSVEGIKKLYVGHTPTVEGKVVIGNVHYMDSGAVFTGQTLRIEEIIYE